MLQAYNLTNLAIDLGKWMNARFLNPISNIEADATERVY